MDRPNDIYVLLKKTTGASPTTLQTEDLTIVGSFPQTLAATSSVLFFLNAGDLNTGIELWKTDGPAASRGKDIYAGNSSSGIANAMLVGSTLYLTATDGTHGNELWISDGTAGGTNMVRDIFPGSAPANPSNPIANGSIVYFTAENGLEDFELWQTDGTTNGTHMRHPSGLRERGHIEPCGFRRRVALCRR